MSVSELVLLKPDTPYARVYQALDAALASGERAVAPGTEAAVQSALYELRAGGGPAEAVSTLQGISVDLTQLFSALAGATVRNIAPAASVWRRSRKNGCGSRRCTDSCFAGRGASAARG
jgi:hypothetical protein